MSGDISAIERIAMILDRQQKTKGFVHDVEAPRGHILAGYYLGQKLLERQVLESLAAQPRTEAVQKLLLTNLAQIAGRRAPNLRVGIEYVITSTSGSFAGMALEHAAGLAFLVQSRQR